MKKAIFAFLGTFGIAGVALAQNFTYTNRVINQAHSYLISAVTILMVLMTVFFLWAVFRFISNKEATKAADKKKLMWNALLGLFIAVAVWGIIAIAQRITGTDSIGTPNIVCPPGYHASGGVCVPGN